MNCRLKHGNERFAVLDNSSDDDLDIVFIEVEVSEGRCADSQPESTSAIEADDYVHIHSESDFIAEKSETNVLKSVETLGSFKEPLAEHVIDPLVEPVKDFEPEPHVTPLLEPANGLLADYFVGQMTTQLIEHPVDHGVEPLVEPLENFIEPLFEPNSTDCTISSYAMKTTEKPAQQPDRLVQKFQEKVLATENGETADTPLKLHALAWAVSWDNDLEDDSDY